MNGLNLQEDSKKHIQDKIGIKGRAIHIFLITINCIYLSFVVLNEFSTNLVLYGQAMVNEWSQWANKNERTSKLKVQ